MRLRWTAAAALLWAGAAVAGEAPSRWAVAIPPSGHEFSLEVAADPQTRARGYMFREHVGPREGMLFIFEESDRHAFWMKSCRVHLDIVWLDEALRVVHVAQDLSPCPATGPCPSVGPPAPARYVLEFASGTARSEGLKVGDVIAVLSDPPLR